MVVDDLLARLKTIGAAAVFDTDIPDRHTMGAVPTLILQHVSSVPEQSIDGTVYGESERYQVSVRGTNLHKVRTMAQAVIAALHRYTSESIARADYDSWPGTISEGSGSTREYHAPVDFNIWRNN